MLAKFEVRNFNCILTIKIYNAQKYRGNVIFGTTSFSKIFKYHVRTVPGNVFLKFEVPIVNRIGAIRI